jgi:hypothetical protein
MINDVLETIAWFSAVIKTNGDILGGKMSSAEKHQQPRNKIDEPPDTHR